MIEAAVVMLFVYISARLQEWRIRYRDPNDDDLCRIKDATCLKIFIVRRNRLLRLLSLLTLSLSVYVFLFSGADVYLKALCVGMIVLALAGYGSAVSWLYFADDRDRKR